MSAPMNGPIGRLHPADDGDHQQSIAAEMPAVPGATWAFCQTSRMPPEAAKTLARGVGQQRDGR